MWLNLVSALFKNWQIIAIGFSIFGLYGYAHHTGYELGESGVQREWDASTAEAKKEADINSAKLEKELADQRIRNRAINSKLEKTIGKNNAYHSCVYDDDSLHILHEAIGH